MVIITVARGGEGGESIGAKVENMGGGGEIVLIFPPNLRVFAHH